MNKTISSPEETQQAQTTQPDANLSRYQKHLQIITQKESLIKAKKKKLFQETAFRYNWQRMGFFSYCSNYSYSDIRYMPKRPISRAEDGSIVFQKRNFMAGPPRTGMTRDGVFSMPSFTASGDLYQDEHSKFSKERKEKYEKMLQYNKTAWKAQGKYKDKMEKEQREK